MRIDRSSNRFWHNDKQCQYVDELATTLFLDNIFPLNWLEKAFFDLSIAR